MIPALVARISVWEWKMFETLFVINKNQFQGKIALEHSFEKFLTLLQFETLSSKIWNYLWRKGGGSKQNINGELTEEYWLKIHPCTNPLEKVAVNNESTYCCLGKISYLDKMSQFWGLLIISQIKPELMSAQFYVKRKQTSLQKFYLSYERSRRSTRDV